MLDANNEGTVLQAEREAFYERARKHSLAPLWRVLHGLVPKQPESPARATIWRYAEIRPFLLEASTLIGATEAERRVLILENPGLPGESKITRSLYAGLQIVMPGEVAPVHRHAAGALRFVLESVGGQTTVNGERTRMAPGDFVVTPSWKWHEHSNDGDCPVVWLDCLDIHIVNLLDCGFREDSAQLTHALSRQMGASLAEAGFSMLPDSMDRSQKTSPIFNYSYARACEALHGVAQSGEPSPTCGYKMRYVNPLNGDWAMPTISTWLQLLPKRFRSTPSRSTDGTIYVVVEGRGRSTIAGQMFDWGPQDIFVVPSWCEVSHVAAAESVLFAASDRVVQEKLGIWRQSVAS
jgi:gentisate 1,2-dioxygenase